MPISKSTNRRRSGSTREERVGQGASSSATVPGFISETANTVSAVKSSERVLVVIQLAGGNDGLNTVVPYSDDAYYRARPTLALKPNRILKVDDRFGFHPHLGGLRHLFDRGQLGILHGVGYPNPNRSHFRSMEIWETASDPDKKVNTGWLGRYFDHSCKGEDPTVGISIGEMLPQAFRAVSPTGVSFERPADYRWTPLDGTFSHAAAESVFAATNNFTRTMAGPAELDARLFLRRVALNARLSSHRILAIQPDGSGTGAYPDTPLGKSLQMIARMISGGFSTRVYYASQSGYDTHNSQAVTHDRLIGEFSDSVRALCQDLEATGDLERVLILAFSEFGRRVAENGSAGTDHGKAAPVFLMGGSVRPGFLGVSPSLTELDDGDQRHNVDFRSVYAALLEDWLGTDAEAVLGRIFPKVSILR